MLMEEAGRKKIIHNWVYTNSMQAVSVSFPVEKMKFLTPTTGRWRNLIWLMVSEFNTQLAGSKSGASLQEDMTKENCPSQGGQEQSTGGMPERKRPRTRNKSQGHTHDVSIYPRSVFNNTLGGSHAS